MLGLRLFFSEFIMNKTVLIDYTKFQLLLSSASLSLTPSETHGLLVGMLSGGLSLNDESWQPLLFDYTNDGMGWPIAILTEAESLLRFSANELIAEELLLSLLIPTHDDLDSLFEKADGVCEWVNHFISGLGLMRVNIRLASTAAKEALTDLEEMSKLGIDEEDSLEEQALLLEQVIEHIKVCVLTIHSEFGVFEKKDQSKSTLH